jgi:hypothetical protein
MTITPPIAMASSMTQRDVETVAERMADALGLSREECRVKDWLYFYLLAYTALTMLEPRKAV